MIRHPAQRETLDVGGTVHAMHIYPVEARAAIQTFAFFDLETTGLIGKNYMPDITELSIVAVGRDAFLDHQVGQVPRIVRKLSIPVRPEKSIRPEASKLTGKSANLT